VTQLASPSSRRHGEGRGPLDAEHLLRRPAPASPEYSLEPPRGRHATPRGQGFERVVGWTILGSIVPGSGLIAAGRRGLGGFVVTVTVLLTLAAAGAALMVDPTTFVASLLGDPNKILLVAGGMIALALGWMIVVLTTHSATRRYGTLTGGQRMLATLLVLSLIGAVAVPTVYAAQDALLARDTLNTIFTRSNSPLNKNSKVPNTTKADPWAGVPRVNVLLMGSDAGLDRTGIRPDTMIVASINTQTGKTVLISLPRNLQHAPFPPGSKGAEAFPDGFYCYNAAARTNTECLLNALWTWGDGHPAYYPGDKHPGLTATVQAIEQLTGLTIDQYVMLNLRGFEDFVDAIGGVTINAKSKIPVGGHGNRGDADYSAPTSWIKPGVQRMDGYHALWYARSRQFTSDFDRMGRQRCVIGAVVGQANPAALALGFADILRTLQKNFLTSIPTNQLNAWVTLALRVKKSKITSLAFTDAVINTVHPNVTKMHRLVQNAINPPTPTPTAASPSTSTSPTKPKPRTTTPASQAADLTEVC